MKDYGWIAVDKHSRKKELITGLQQCLVDTWMKFVPNMDQMETEFRDAEWIDESLGKIKNSTKYHLLDALQYLIDNLPESSEPRVELTRDQAIIEAHMATQAAQAKLASDKQNKTKSFKLTSDNRFRRRLW